MDPKTRARCNGLYELTLHLYLSAWSRPVLRASRAIRGKHKGPRRPTLLPKIRWSAAMASKPIFLVETEMANGNVRACELAILAKAAAATEPGREIVEIGTFDGRTTLNLAVNGPATSPIHSLDLPPDQETRFSLEPAERRFIEKPAPGARYRDCGAPWAASAARIVQHLGDSATFDWSPREGRAGLVFVDGSHAYDYARADSETALLLVAPGGMVLWHDYGVWEGVTRALDEMEASQRLGLRQLYGTSLVFWRDPRAAIGPVAVRASAPDAPPGRPGGE